MSGVYNHEIYPYLIFCLSEPKLILQYVDSNIHLLTVSHEIFRGNLSLFSQHCPIPNLPILRFW